MHSSGRPPRACCAPRVLLLIRALDVGGAERQCVLLARELHQRGVDVRVLSFYPGGALRDELQRAGVPVADLGKRGRWDVLPFLVRLVGALRRQRPAVLYSFLPMANILSAVSRLCVRGMRVAWGVRASNVEHARYGWLVRIAARIESGLARCADVIIANSAAGRTYHIGQGFPAGRFIVIANGIDSVRCRRDVDGRRRLRAEWGVTEDDVLVGLCARLDPMKGHEVFLKAAALLLADGAAEAPGKPRPLFVCVGDGAPAYRENLRALSRQLGLPVDRVIWAGNRLDMPAVFSALDIATAPSLYGEGFSNSIAEAMACETLCVVADVGDSAAIVGDTGVVVAPGDATALARAWSGFVNMPAQQRASQGARARQRVVTSFSVDAMVGATLRALAIE